MGFFAPFPVCGAKTPPPPGKFHRGAACPPTSQRHLLPAAWRSTCAQGLTPSGAVEGQGSRRNADTRSWSHMGGGIHLSPE
eukprot:gene14857-biopygen12671